MKSIINKFLTCGVTVALASVLFSCEKDQNLYSGEQVPVGPDVTISDITIPSSILENDVADTVIVTLSKAYSYDVHLYVLEESGTNTVGNFSIPDRVIIPAGDTMGTLIMTTDIDCNSGDDNLVKFTVGEKPSANANVINPQTVEFTIKNNITGVFDALQSWEVEGDNPTSETAYSLLDLDMYAINADTAAAYNHDVATPEGLAEALAYQFGAGYQGYPYSWTGGAEHLEFSPDAPDGHYILVAEKYSEVSLGDLGDLSFNIKGSYFQCSVPSNTDARDVKALPKLSDPKFTLYTIDELLKAGKVYNINPESSSTARKFLGDNLSVKIKQQLTDLNRNK